MKILVAEDKRDARELLTALLKTDGHEVTAVEDGRLAWNAFEEERFTLVISDWLMPEVDGLELCRRIRATPRSIYPYVILLTALEGKEHYLEGMMAGADDFLCKPFDPETLRARLRVAERIVQLQERVKHLEGILPTCMYCKKIRDDQNLWVGIEDYITRRVQVSFSHGVCPDCYDRFVKPELDQIP